MPQGTAIDGRLPATAMGGGEGGKGRARMLLAATRARSRAASARSGIKGSRLARASVARARAPREGQARVLARLAPALGPASWTRASAPPFRFDRPAGEAVI